MAQVVLIEAQPLTADGSATVLVRLAGGGGNRAYTGYLGAEWRSGVVAVPRFTTAIGFDQSGWTGGAVPQTGVVSFSGSDRALLNALGNLFWRGAKVTVYVGDDAFGAPSFTTLLVGTVAEHSVSGNTLRLTIADLAADLNKPIAISTFAGTGGLEGGDAATGRIKRRSWGRVFNVEGRVLDGPNNIYEFGDTGAPLQAFDAVKDKGVAGAIQTLAAGSTPAATLANLRASTPPRNGAIVAPSIACVKWWTVPAGPLTADIRGETGAVYVETPAAIAGRLVTLGSTATMANLGAAITLRNFPAGIHVDDANETFASAIDRVLNGVSLFWTLSPAGAVTIGEFSWGTASQTIEALRSDTIERETTYSPLSFRKIGFQRNHRIHSQAEINANLLLATDVTYVDGTPIETLKPLEAGANKTETRVAAAIAGQGPGATANGSSVLNNFLQIGADGRLIGGGGGQVTYGGLGGKALGLLDFLSFGSDRLTESPGGATATLDAFKTILGQAASFLGQGALATLSKLFFGDGKLLESDGGPTAALNAFKTILGSAASIQGQGALATLSQLANGGNYLTGFGGLSGQDFIRMGGPVDNGQNFRYAGILSEQGSFTTDSGYRTSFGVSAAFAGQTAWATTGQLNRDSLFSASYFSLNAFSLGYTVTRQDGTSIVTESLAITSLGVAAAFIGQGGLATRNDVGTPQITANAITAPAFTSIDNGGSMGNYPQGTWANFDTNTSGGSGGSGGGAGGGGGGRNEVALQ